VLICVPDIAVAAGARRRRVGAAADGVC
jgi:hypothetical protein